MRPKKSLDNEDPYAIIAKAIIQKRAENKTNLTLLCKRMGYSFKNINLLIRALTRRSAIEESIKSKKEGDFQRLEYLGDKALGLAISTLLSRQCPSFSPGKLTEAAKKFVSNTVLSNVAKRLKLGNYLIVGRGEELNKIRENNDALSDALEAVIAAMYLDSHENIQIISAFVQKHWQVKVFSSEKVSQLFEDNLAIVLPELAAANELGNITEALLPNFKRPDMSFNELIIYSWKKKARKKRQKATGWHLIHKGEKTTLAKIFEEVISRQGGDDEDLSDVMELLDAIFSGNLTTIHNICQNEYGIDTSKLSYLDFPPKIEVLQGLTLHIAVNLNNTALIKLLMQYHFNIDAVNKHRETPLHGAVTHDSPDCVECLIDCGASLNSQDINGNTPLHALFFSECSDKEAMLSILLDAGCAPGILNFLGETPLHIAAKMCNEWEASTFKRLLKEGGMNVKNQEEQSPLHLAALHGRAENVSLLLKQGANSGLEDKNGLTIDDYAKKGLLTQSVQSILLKMKNQQSKTITNDKKLSLFNISTKTIPHNRRKDDAYQNRRRSCEF